MGRRDLSFLALILGGVGCFAAPLIPPRDRAGGVGGDAVVHPEKPAVAERVDAALRGRSLALGATPAPSAPDLAVYRRLSLALTGTIPALAAIRRFEAWPAADRLASAREELLADPRTGDYLAERLARAFVGTEGGPFLVYRRRRLVAWLADELRLNRPYDQIVRDLIAGEGLWTSHPATNFVSVTFDPDREAYDPERLAARVARAFLGVRIDCAQCHDHPFAAWRRADFRGLAAFFGQVGPTFRGVTDGPGEFRAPTRAGGELVAIAPRVPFRPDLVPEAGSRRGRLAGWVTDPANRHFARATANRAWALLFGRPLVEPIDDLDAADAVPEALELLAADFARGGFDLRALLRAIAATEAFARDSAAAEDENPGAPPPEVTWATFPLTRLRPEQVAGAVLQSAATATIDGDSPLLLRLATFGGIDEFVARHGDLGADEFAPQATSTIPQRLLLMNGDLLQKQIREDILNASGRIAALAPDDPTAVEAAYLAALTRRPTPGEAAHFAARLARTGGADRKARVSDLLWVLLNSTEFSYNH